MSRRKQHRRVQKRRRDKKPKRKPTGRTSPPNVRSHPIYGDIPMVQAEIQVDGKTYSFEDFDPDYQPPMPRGAVRGDVRRQEYCRMCHTPRYFHVDRMRRCVQCEAEFLFSAREQKYWYETLKFCFDSVAIRCKSCRRQRRNEKALHRQLAATLDELSANPEDPAQLVALAETTVELWKRTGHGKLNRAIAAARKAAKLWPEHAPATFWLARCQEAKGRDAKALELYARFCGIPGAIRHRVMWRHARGLLLGPP